MIVKFGHKHLVNNSKHFPKTWQIFGENDCEPLSFLVIKSWPNKHLGWPANLFAFFQLPLTAVGVLPPLPCSKCIRKIKIYELGYKMNDRVKIKVG